MLKSYGLSLSPNAFEDLASTAFIPVSETLGTGTFTTVEPQAPGVGRVDAPAASMLSELPAAAGQDTWVAGQPNEQNQQHLHVRHSEIKARGSQVSNRGNGQKSVPTRTMVVAEAWRADVA